MMFVARFCEVMEVHGYSFSCIHDRRWPRRLEKSNGRYHGPTALKMVLLVLRVLRVLKVLWVLWVLRRELLPLSAALLRMPSIAAAAIVTRAVASGIEVQFRHCVCAVA
jgi:hypothetical protein